MMKVRGAILERNRRDLNAGRQFKPLLRGQIDPLHSVHVQRRPGQSFNANANGHWRGQLVIQLDLIGITDTAIRQPGE